MGITSTEIAVDLATVNEYWRSHFPISSLF